MNAPNCEKVCEQKAGIVYNDKLLSDIHCCQKALFKDGICPINGQIDLGICNQDTLADRIIGLVSKWCNLNEKQMLLRSKFINFYSYILIFSSYMKEYD